MSTTDIQPIPLRRLGGSLYIAIPAKIIRANNLKPGDYLILDPTKIRILREEDFELLGRELEGETVE